MLGDERRELLGQVVDIDRRGGHQAARRTYGEALDLGVGV